MINYDFTFNGTSASSLGIRLQEAISISAPTPNVTAYSVPGRNGDLHIYDGSYKNRTAQAKCYFYAPPTPASPDAFSEKLHAISEWLLSGQGYFRLEHSDDPTHYMMGRVTNGAEISARIHALQPFTIKFDCKPQRFFKESTDPTSPLYPPTIVLSGASATAVLKNPSNFRALPLITFKTSASSAGVNYGRAAFNVIGDTSENNKIEMPHAELWLGETITFDCETQNAYSETDNFNPYLELAGELYLVPKSVSEETRVTIRGRFVEMTIHQRWWEP